MRLGILAACRPRKENRLRKGSNDQVFLTALIITAWFWIDVWIAGFAQCGGVVFIMLYVVTVSTLAAIFWLPALLVTLIVAVLSNAGLPARQLPWRTATLFASGVSTIWVVYMVILHVKAGSPSCPFVL
jgi:hypothetical protein